MQLRKIVTSYFRVPGPAPQFDWTAYYDGMEEAGPYGHGTTPQEAINDLVDNYETEFGDEAADVTVEKYPNPNSPRGYEFMAHADTLEAAGIFGFGSTEQEAISEFRRELALVELEVEPV